MRKGLALLAALFLVGCTSVREVPVERDVLPVFHPSLPEPVEVCNIKWNVLVLDENPYVALTYNDNITAAICFNEYERYIIQLLRVACSYRTELKEEICNNGINNSGSTTEPSND